MEASTEELLDIYDEDMQWRGTATRAEVHRQGYWHQTFHCWVRTAMNGQDCLVLQRRHRLKDTNPGKLDVSCAGHLGAGEEPRDGIRELREELGIEVNSHELLAVGAYRDRFRYGDLIDNECCHIFIYRDNESASLQNYRPALDEVSGLYLIDAPTFARLCRGGVNSAEIRGYAIGEGDNWTQDERRITLNDLVERSVDYYNLLFGRLEI